MTHKQIYKVTANDLVIHLPKGFMNKNVLVIVDELEKPIDKIALMKQAATDPLYLQDMEDVNNDFAGIDHETI